MQSKAAPVYGPALSTHHFVPSDTTVIALFEFVAPAFGASKVTVVVPAVVPTGVTKHWFVDEPLLTRFTLNIRPGLPEAEGSVIVMPADTELPSQKTR